ESGKTLETGITVSAKAAEEAASAGEAVKVPVEVKAEKTAEQAAPVKVTVPKTEEPVKVEIPVENLTEGTVAVLVKEDGSEEIIKTSTLSEEGVVVPLEGSATIKIVDNTKTFNDVKPTDWFAGNVAWAASHEIMKGIGGDTFNANANTNRGMVSQILFNLEGATAGNAAATAFGDVKPTDWFAPAVSWMAQNGIAQGDGKNFGADNIISREQLAMMFFNYAKFKGYDVTTRADLSKFSDTSSVSDYAKEAMSWAVGTGLFNGVAGKDGSVTLAAQGSTTRGMVAAIAERFCENIIK
ncbi:MAG: S-layer homology domain-containing protein, partial [Firmicutes bacterium]|nr:S-layer homology domain-containing protein [Bacillota bacterium]